MAHRWRIRISQRQKSFELYLGVAIVYEELDSPAGAGHDRHAKQRIWSWHGVVRARPWFIEEIGESLVHGGLTLRIPFGLVPTTQQRRTYESEAHCSRWRTSLACWRRASALTPLSSRAVGVQ